MAALGLLNVMKARRLILFGSAAVGLCVGLVLAVVLPTEYVSAAKVQVDSIQRNSLTGLVEPRLRVAEYLGQQAAIASSRTVSLEVINRLADEGFIILSDFEERWRKDTGGELVAGNDLKLWAADEILRDLTVTADDIASTLELGFRAENPAQAARVANAFASAYMAAILDHKQRRFARKARDFSDETRALAADVSEAQSQLADYREESGVLPMGEQRLEASEIELAAVTERLAQARADAAEARSLLAQAEATPKSQLINFPVPVDAVAGRQAIDRLNAVAPVLARLAERYGPRHPDFIETAREKAALEANILAAIRDRADYATSRVEALERQAAALKDTVTGMQATRERYDLLEEKVRASQETYNLVATRSLEESLQSRIDAIDVFLLARATPPANPATPPFWAIALIGMVAGVAIGASAAVFAELLEGRIRSVDAIRRTLRTSFVCEVDRWRPAPRRKNLLARFA